MSVYHARRVDPGGGGGGSLQDLAAARHAEGVAGAAGASRRTSHTQSGNVEMQQRRLYHRCESYKSNSLLRPGAMDTVDIGE